jgi:hypothetical protein
MIFHTVKKLPEYEKERIMKKVKTWYEKYGIENNIISIVNQKIGSKYYLIEDEDQFVVNVCIPKNDLCLRNDMVSGGPEGTIEYNNMSIMEKSGVCNHIREQFRKNADDAFNVNITKNDENYCVIDFVLVKE